MSIKQIQQINRITLSTKFLGKTKPQQFNYFSDGGEVPTGVDYHAHYLKNGSIAYMTGDKHSPTTSKIITPVSKLSIEDDRQTYQALSNNNKFLNPVVSGKTKPNDVNYKQGYFTRFFAKKSGDNIPFEIKKALFDVDTLYEYTFLDWKLTGDRTKVMEANRQAVLIADKNFRGLKKLITNYIKYYK